MEILTNPPCPNSWNLTVPIASRRCFGGIICKSINLRQSAHCLGRQNILRLYVCGLFSHDSLRTHISDDLIETLAFCSAVAYLGFMRFHKSSPAGYSRFWLYKGNNEKPEATKEIGLHKQWKHDSRAESATRPSATPASLDKSTQAMVFSGGRAKRRHRGTGRVKSTQTTLAKRM